MDLANRPGDPEETLNTHTVDRAPDGPWPKTRQREGKHILLEKHQGNRERKVPSTGYICWRRLCSLCGLQRFYNLQLSQIWKIHSWMKKHKRVLLRLQDIKYICLLKHSTQKTRSHSTQNFWHITYNALSPLK